MSGAPRILVVGAGATGGFFGGRLHQAGADVSFLLRPGRRKQIASRGLVIHAHDGGADRLDPPTLEAGEFEADYDLVLLTVKATALSAALEDLEPAVGPGTLVAPLLNGMAQVDAVSERFGLERTLPGVVQIVGTLDADGDVVQMTPLAKLALGPLPGAEIPSERLEAIAARLGTAAFDFSLESDVLAAMWGKWAMIASAAALCSLMRASVGEIVAQPGGAALAEGLLSEAAATAAAHGHPLAAASYASSLGRLTEPGSDFTASLYRDLQAGQVTEGEHLIGDLIRRARQVGLSTPRFDLARMHLAIADARHADAADANAPSAG